MNKIEHQYKIGDKVVVKQQSYGKVIRQQETEIIGITPKGFLKIKCTFDGKNGYALFDPCHRHIRGYRINPIYFEPEEIKNDNN